MANIAIESHYPNPVMEVRRQLRSAAVKLRLEVAKDSEEVYEVRYRHSPLEVPINVQARVVASDGGSTVHYIGSMRGLGVLVNGKMEAAVGMLDNALRDLLEPSNQDAPQADPVAQLERLMVLRQQGVLTDEEFNRAKDKLLS